MNFQKHHKSDIADRLPGLHARLWRYCMVTTGNRADADDLVQQTCLRALENQGQYHEDGKLDRWLFTMARRLWLNESRARKVRLGGGHVAAEESGLASTTPDAETNILASEVLNQIMGLPSEQRIAVLLVYGEGHSYREAADIMDCPIGTIMSRLATARKRLNQACPTEVEH